EDEKPVSRETLLRRIEAHIETVVGRYADVATMWDVVNEAVADSGDSLLRDSVYSRTTGIDFIVTAFKAARAKDPDALLIYNDFPWKRVNHPLLFDRQLRPKPAFDAVYATLNTSRTSHAPVERRDPNSRLAHQQLVAKAKQGTIDVYFEGDSITRRWGATDYP